ncbi:hypothetical protein ABT301_10005 [Streptomyces sp. NPDC000987]|uniref:hypothetical protein n=1 Tax=Streptomyces sp. NPDC000987 TaxID=3154374 RepID=UPI00331801C1
MLRHISERHARGFGAAVVAVVALLLAANAGPARAADLRPTADRVAVTVPYLPQGA